jgi:hypothetical protein
LLRALQPALFLREYGTRCSKASLSLLFLFEQVQLGRGAGSHQGAGLLVDATITNVLGH